MQQLGSANKEVTFPFFWKTTSFILLTCAPNNFTWTVAIDELTGKEPSAVKANTACFQALRLSSDSGYSLKNDTRHDEAKSLGASTYQGVIIQIHLPRKRPPCCSDRKLLPALNLALPVFLDHLQLSCKQRKHAVVRVLSLAP